jgi:carbonic anhydrase
MIGAIEALARLREGNRRFASGVGVDPSSIGVERRRSLVAGQEPSTIVLGCSDSRVPPEIIFGQGLGDVFSLRVAGNITPPQLVGSLEFAAEMFGTRLVVVLGHSGCGAVEAAGRKLDDPPPDLSPELQAILDQISPSVESVSDAAQRAASDDWVRLAVRANICRSTHRLRHQSPALERLARKQGLSVVGAEYDLETGLVDFFDGVPAAG